MNTRETQIDLAKKLIETGISDEAREVLEKQFPELTESEDERIRKDIINLIYWLKDNPSLCSQYYIDRYDGMLAWLEKQKAADIESIKTEFYNAGYEDGKEYMQKPSEWSEEDEIAFGDLMWCVEQARKSARGENDMGACWSAERWLKERLKSIHPRPHWKPSEEQMEALKYVIESLPPSNWHRDLLNQVYEELKKL